MNPPKKLIAIIITAVVVGCTVQHEKERELVTEFVQTIDKGNVLDLNVRIQELTYDSIITTADSLNEVLKKWDDKYEHLADSTGQLWDSLTREYLQLSDSANTFPNNSWKRKQINRKASAVLDKSIDVSSYYFHYCEMLEIPLPYEYNPKKFNVLSFKRDLESRRDTFHIYTCKYTLLNPELNVDQTLTKQFVFDDGLTRVIRSIY